MQKRIEGVPFEIQKPNWCGYACLSMVLRYWGYDYSQEQVFDVAFGPVATSRKFSSDVNIGIGNLALAAQQMTALRVDLWSEECYTQARTKKINLAPSDVLRAYLAKDMPCIVRLPHHYNVAIGFDTDATTYTFNETNGSTVERTAECFEELWSDLDPAMPYDTRHLLLAIRPKT